MRAETGLAGRVPVSVALILPLESDVPPIPWPSSSHKEPAYFCDRGAVGGGRRVIADYCYSSRHFISSEISISPPYWACYGTDLPSHTMFPLSTSDDQTAGPQTLLLSKKVGKSSLGWCFSFLAFSPTQGWDRSALICFGSGGKKLGCCVCSVGEQTNSVSDLTWLN